MGESQLSLTVPGEGGPIDATFGAQVWAGLPRTGNILLGAGALSLSLAQAIVNDPPQQTGLTIVTNYLDAAVVLSRSSQLAVYNIGGTVSATTRAQEGDWAVAELERLHTDIALICPEGISVERGLSQSTPAAAAISQAEVTAGGRVIALVEAETLGTDSFIRYAGIGEVDQLAIHGQPSSTQLLPFTDRGVSVSVVGEP